MTDDPKRSARIAKLDELTDLVIDDMLDAARAKRLTSADRKLMLDFLRQNGLELNPNATTRELGNLLTSPPQRFDDGDADVLPFRNTANG